MLGTTPTKTTKPSDLIAFEPRQVTLAKQREMKNKKTQSETLENDSSDQIVTHKSSRKDKSKKKSKSDSTPLLLSIAAYLEHNGFSNTLTTFRSEALIEEFDDLKGHSLDLDMFYKYLEASKHDAIAKLKGSEELDLQKDGTVEKEESKHAVSVESIRKKKRKKGKGRDADMVNEQHGVSNGFSKCAANADEKLTNEVVPMFVVKSKEKKKKSKLVSDSSDKSTQEVGSETVQNPAENAVCELQLDGSDKKSKNRMKKKNKPISAENIAQSDIEALPEAIEEKTRDSASSQSAVCIDGKGSKKRKRLASEGNESQPESKIQLDGLAEGNEATKDSVVKNKVDVLANGNFDKNGREGSPTQKSTKKQRNDSAEPKTVHAFQRVKIDEVEFVDKRLQDNSYWAKDGADSGYGAKAQEVLGQVRGRDFRHEKTKKKRGSYRGGQIDLQSHSIKFNYSDEE